MSVIKRSPAYPVLDLERAVQYAHNAYKIHKNNEVSRDELIEAMAYIGGSNGPNKAFSDLQQYGLIEHRGTGKACVSELSRQILEPQNNELFIESLELAADKPQIFNRLERLFQGSSNVTVDNVEKLLADRGFNPTAFSKVFSSYRKTQDYVAQSKKKDQVKQKGEPSVSSGVEVPERFFMSTPIGGGAIARVFVTGDVGSKEIEHLISVLEVQKDILSS